MTQLTGRHVLTVQREVEARMWDCDECHAVSLVPDGSDYFTSKIPEPKGWIVIHDISSYTAFPGAYVLEKHLCPKCVAAHHLEALVKTPEPSGSSGQDSMSERR